MSRTIGNNNYNKLKKRFNPKEDAIDLAISMMPYEYRIVFISKWGINGSCTCKSSKQLLRRINGYYTLNGKLNEKDIGCLVNDAENMFININKRFSIYYLFSEFTSNLEYTKALKLVSLLEDVYYGEVPEVVIKRSYNDFKKIIFDFLYTLSQEERNVIISFYGLLDPFNSLEYSEIASKFDTDITKVKEIIISFTRKLRIILGKD